MDFIKELRNLSIQITKQRDLATTEEATKLAFVVPFIKIMGYDPANLTEVRPEFTKDLGTKQGEKVDYAVFKNGEEIMLIECKKYGVDLSDAHISQLYRYFSVASARIAVLTDGSVYRFYTDLEASNKMDTKPFLEFNMLDIQEPLVNELKRFRKPEFDLDTVLTAAKDLKYTKEIKQIMVEELEAPSEDFVRFFLSKVYNGLKMPAVIQSFTDIVKRALNEFLNEQINERSQSAISGKERVEKVVEVEESDASTEQEVKRFKTLVSESEYRDFYESKNQIEKLCEFGVDLMALCERKQWELTPNFKKYTFALYLKNRRVFGVVLFARPKLAVWLPEDVLDKHNNDLLDDQYTYTYNQSYGCGIYLEDVTVADIEKLLEVTYSFHNRR